jgi:CRISPR-associated protein, csm2 family
MYDDRNFKGRGVVEKKRTPIVLENDNYVEQAEKVILKLMENRKILTTSKIRKLLAMLSDIYVKARRIKTNTLDNAIRVKIQYFKLHTIYEAGREATVRSFVEEAQLIEQIDKIGSDKSKLILFCHYMEALVAYRKYRGGRDE